MFVDDLEETFLEPDFPEGIEKILFAPHDHAPVPGARMCRSWDEIREQVLFSRLLDRPLDGIGWIGGGGNSRIYRLPGPCAGKVYFQQHRLDVEFAALQFCWQHGVRCVPQPIAADPPARLAVYEFIEGAKPVATAADIDAAVTFLATLRTLAAQPDAATLPPAAEACFTVAAIVENLEHRLARLAGVAALRQFLDERFRPLLARLVAGLPELPAAERTLSPSDFGFHNALRRPDGRLVFLDFEYFGWDDPAKMISDFLLHPAMELSAELKQRFYGALATNKGLAKRVETVYPLFGLKWCLILLNEFLPEDLQRRGFAAGGALDRGAAQARQLDKARRLLARIERESEQFPY